MIKNYLKTAIRNLLKNRSFTIINMLGVAIGMAACLLILQYVMYEYSYDKFHENSARIYRIQYNNYQNGVQTFACAAAVPAVGPAMKNNFPEIEEFARFFPLSGVMSYIRPDGTRITFREEKMQVATPSALTMFSFPLVQGNYKTALNEPFKAVISESAARRYFGKEDPMGKTLDWEEGMEFEITGVMQDVPENSHIKFEILLSFETLNVLSQGEPENSWFWYDFNTYVLLKPGTNPAVLQAKWDQWLVENRGDEWKESDSRQEFLLQPLTDIHLYSNLLQESEPEEQGNGRAVLFLVIIVVFILLIAWVNYVNLSTARAVNRANEVGVRKALGASRHQLMWQFIFEAFLVNLVAIVLALLITVIMLPQLGDLTGRPLSLALLGQSWFWLTVFGLFLVGTFLSGLYPAFLLSGYRPITVLKGKVNTSSKGILLRKGLVIFQFGASVALIAGTLIVFQQLKYMMNQDLGVDIDQVIVLRGAGIRDSLYAEDLNTFKTELMRNKDISAVTISSNVPGEEIFWTTGIRRLSGGPENGFTIYNVAIDYDYVSTFDLDMKAGRDFSREFRTDEKGLLLNEAAVRTLEFESAEKAINEKVVLGGDTLTLVGILEDYHQMSLKNQTAPIAFRLIPDAEQFYSVKVQTQRLQETIGKLQATWSAFFPGNPFEYFFLDDYFNRQYKNDRLFGKVFGLFAVLAIFVACLGLFGLASFTTVQRNKEIGVRKVLGATVPSIVALLSKEFVKLVLLASLFAIPVAFFVMRKWLATYPYKIDLTWWMFLLPLIIVVVIALVTVSFQTLKAALSNPVNALKDE